MTAVREVLRFPDGESLADLETFVGRARRVDPDGVIRLVAHGDVLAVYVSPVHGGGGPVVIGLRTLRLAHLGPVDVTVPLAALAERFAPRPDDGGSAEHLLDLPAAEAPGVAWAGTTPPRRGWEAVTAVPADVLAGRALEGVMEVVAGTPPGAGSAAVAALRARIWGRPLDAGDPATAGLPSGVAYVAEALGFLDGAEPAAVYRCGPWWRLTTGRGHVLARRPALG